MQQEDGAFGRRETLEQRIVREVHRGAIGDVVDQHIAVGRRGDRLEVGDQAVLARPVVVGADRDDALEGQPLEPPQGLDDLGRRIATHADEHRNAAGDGERALDQCLALGLVERRGFAGGAEWEQGVDALSHVVRHQALVACKVDRAILERRALLVADRVERRDHRGGKLAGFLQHRVHHILGKLAVKPLIHRPLQPGRVLERKRDVRNRRAIGHGSNS